jgi:hypothetical protein
MARNDIPIRPENSSRWPKRASVALIGLGLVCYAWVDATAAPFSMRALVGVLIPGVVLAAMAYRGRYRRIAPPGQLDITGMSYWVISLTMLFEWEASAFRDSSWPWHPSLTNLINPLLAPHPLKSAAIVVWLLAGWALVKR